MNITNDGDAIVVALEAEYSGFDQLRLADMQRTLFEKVAAASPPRIVFDMSQTRYFGSEFLEVLFRVWNRCVKRGGKFAIASVHDSAAETLQVTHLDTLWNVHPTVAEALADVKS